MESGPRTHRSPGVKLLEHTVYELPTSRASCSSSSRSSNIMTFTVGKHKSYTLSAYPGPDVVTDRSRAEHLPLHFHVKCRQGGRELRILTESFQEYDGQFIPRDLRKYFEQEGVAQYLRDNTKSVFETGKPVEKEPI